jgi:hypothetical protein
MVALMFGEDQMSGCITTMSFNVAVIVVVVSWFRVESVIMAKQPRHNE